MTKKARDEAKRQAWLEEGKKLFLIRVFAEGKASYEYTEDNVLNIKYNEGLGLMSIKVDEMWAIPNLNRWIKKILALRW